MASLPVYDRHGAEVGTYQVEPTDLAPRISKQLLHDVVVMYQANLRQGTVKTKSRSEVAGTTKKMYRQKGTGNARAGSRRSGLRRGGGHIHAIRQSAPIPHLKRYMQVPAVLRLIDVPCRRTGKIRTHPVRFLTIRREAERLEREIRLE